MTPSSQRVELLEGVLVQRRVLSRRLAFATVATTSDACSGSGGEEVGQLVAVCFCAEQFMQQPNSAPFPSRRGLLHLGDHVRLTTAADGASQHSQRHVRSWWVLRRHEERGAAKYGAGDTAVVAGPPPPPLAPPPLRDGYLAPPPGGGRVGGAARCPPLSVVPHSGFDALQQRPLIADSKTESEGEEEEEMRAVVVGAPQHSKASRFIVFAEWLIGTFGLEHLACGSGVVDVAGGRGALSFRLQCEHGVPCLLVDPSATAVR